MNKMEQSNHELLELLEQYGSNNLCPMHMPGHKRNIALLGERLPWQLDVTEIGDFDNLHMPGGILKSCQEKAAKLWGSQEAFFLVGGSTSGIIAGIYAATRRGEKILVARNCHKSVYHAIEIFGLVPVYINVSVLACGGVCGSVPVREVERLLARNQDIRMAVITSPTYEGVISDVSEISRLLHEKGIPLMVDEAHGAHLGISPRFPASAVEEGADIVVNSLHKTLPSLTQSAMLHIQGGLIDSGKIRHALSIFQSSSPSYVLMASIDSCVSLLAQRGEQLAADAISRLEELWAGLSGLTRLKLFAGGEFEGDVFAQDTSKLLIFTSATDKNGPWLMEYLLGEGMQLEMASADYVLAVTSVCDTKESTRRLLAALNKAENLCERAEHTGTGISLYPRLGQKLFAGEAVNLAAEYIQFDLSIGRISGEYVWAYPPGIPLITPGAEITQEIVGAACALTDRGVSLSSTWGKLPEFIRVVARN